MSLRIGEGSPGPLGVTPDARGVNVAVFSANATAIEFCLFDVNDRELHRIRLPERTGDVFHGHIDGIMPGERYGLRAHGPFAPEAGHRFNAAKLLVDPHARSLDRGFQLHPSMFGYHFGEDDRSFEASDSAPFMPKALVTAPPLPRHGHAPLAPWRETFVYELHVRGFTKLHPDVPEPLRGTFAGLASPVAIEHLVKLGVTSVELLPCAAWVEERHLAGLGLTNYWGYNPVALVAPEPRLAPGGWTEIRAAVGALADAGIETILDVVLNHSGEGDELGPTLSLRGLDNASYYRLRADDPRYYVDDAGCGNTLALDRPPVVRLAMDALRTWVREAGVHGFRFDLGATMGRRAEGFDPAAPLLTAIDQDPELSCLKLIAEPWDIGPGGYQLGRFPASWGEWNDRYRDDIRRFWRGEPQLLGAAATRLAGSADVFGMHRPASRSVNFVTAHDGFALADLVAHEAKRNHANGEDNRDGSDANHSWNNGAEGPSDDPAVRAVRARDQRALIATLLLSRGTPMLAMGAELGHSQQGNNNGYAQDNELSWLDWEAADESLLEFARDAAAARHELPLLRGEGRLTGEVWPGGLVDVAWHGPSGDPMALSEWEAADAGTVLMLLGGAGERAGVLLHRGREARNFVLPACRPGWRWTVRLNSSDEGTTINARSLVVPARSVLLLVEAASPSGRAEVSRATLDRLSRAAGLQPEWWSVDGDHRTVTDDTRRHLLAAMRLPANSEAEALESLARLAEQRELRPVASSALATAGVAGELWLASEPGLRRPLWLTIEHPGGAETRLLSSGADSASARALDGRAYERRRVLLPALAPGHYRVRRDDCPDLACRLTVAPLRAFLPSPLAEGRKVLGVAAQLYTLRRAGDQGIGDLTTLAELMDAAAAAGADAVGINPLHALFPEHRDRASPYYPSDRRFVDPMYLDMARLVELPGGEALRPILSDPQLARLRAASLVDYPGVWELKQAGLQALWQSFANWSEAHPQAALSGELNRFIITGGHDLANFATFCTLAEANPGAPWGRWPAVLRDPSGESVRRFAAEHPRDVRYHAFVQWLCDRQLAAAAGPGAGMAIGLYRDLAVGSAPDGSEAWSRQHALAPSVSIGAPPDPLGPAGQVWGLPPPDPQAMMAEGFEGFAALLAANMRHAGALRIDHAMGLARLFWVPEGAAAVEGAYVSYPFEPLLAEVTLASQEEATLVIAEDLGTVPEGFRERLSAADVLGYEVMMLERDADGFRPPAGFRPLSLACVTSHDLPTLAGWWRGADIAERADLGQLTSEEAAHEAHDRGADKARFAALAGVADSAVAEVLPPAVLSGVHRSLAGGSSLIAMVQADDLAGEEQAVNLPGTDNERPNWRRKLEMPVETLLAGAHRAALAELAADRPIEDS